MGEDGLAEDGIGQTARVEWREMELPADSYIMLHATTSYRQVCGIESHSYMYLRIEQKAQQQKQYQ